MDGLLPGIRQVRELCRMLEDHKGGDVTALDLRKLHIWTDFFIIATVSSGTHLQGLLRHTKEFALAKGFSVFRGHGKGGAGEEWTLIDMGTAVIHLMTAQVREFYELEKLWLPAERVYPPAG
ncbi:MAG: ribosome silencing factor [Spirochaetaceae bacterium]|nr:ribosome silencing factor [Spirochaetaceae bacterium]